MLLAVGFVGGHGLFLGGEARGEHVPSEPSRAAGGDRGRPLREESSLRLQVSGHMTSPVMGVREQIQQVLLNVVLNAKQTITQDGEIVIALRESDGCVRVTVEGTGCGIPPAMLETLFKKS